MVGMSAGVGVVPIARFHVRMVVPAIVFLERHRVHLGHSPMQRQPRREGMVEPSCRRLLTRAASLTTTPAIRPRRASFTSTLRYLNPAWTLAEAKHTSGQGGNGRGAR
jgi:hypothetical protein